MTDQDRSAAQEALSMFWQSKLAGNGNEVPAMHVVLTKHEADVRRRIADDMRREMFRDGAGLHTAKHIYDAMLSIVNPPEPPKPVLCKHCGAPIQVANAATYTRQRYVHVRSDGATWAMCDLTAEPAEESTR